MTPALPPLFEHQREALDEVLRKPGFILGLEPGLGKTRIVLDAAAALWREGRIDAMLVVAPAPIKSVWLDPDPALGEVAKWLDPEVPRVVEEYTPKTTLGSRHVPPGHLHILVSNPEFVRREARLAPLLAWVQSRRTFLVWDESWNISNPRSAQTKAAYKLAQAAERVVLLNGTPGEPKDLYTQFTIVAPDVFDRMNWWQFRYRFAVLGGFQGRQIVGYRNHEEFARRTAPYIMVRKTRECLDLGDEPVRTQIEAALTPATWKVYTAMRDEMLAELDALTVAVAPQAGVMALRLAQVANGFVGGIEAADPDLLDEGDLPATPLAPPAVRELSREKLDALLAWLSEYWTEPKALIFTRFRADVERTVAVLREHYPAHVVLPLYGTQPTEERQAAKALLAPGGDPRPAIIVANAASGGAGLTFSATGTCVFLGHDHSLRVRRQAEGRVDRTGQTRRITYLDVIATGPNGERTVDHGIVARLRAKAAVADMSISAWRALIAGVDNDAPRGVDSALPQGA